MANEASAEVKIEVSEVAAEQAEAAKVRPTADLSAKELKASLAHQEDAKLHPGGEPEKTADKTSAPGPYSGEGAAEINDPPVRTNRPDVAIVGTLATGAGAHVPPNPDEVHPDGRPVYDEAAASQGKAAK